MTEQQHVQPERSERAEPIVDVPVVSDEDRARREKLKADTDSLLDEIDGLMTEEAIETAVQYHAKGGE